MSIIFWFKKNNFYYIFGIYRQAISLKSCYTARLQDTQYEQEITN